MRIAPRTPAGPDRFLQLPLDEQRSALEIGNHVAADLRRYVVEILIGPSLALNADGNLNHASGAIVSLGGHLLLITADHVVSAYENRLPTEPALIFQVGNAKLDPLERVVWRSRDDDLAFIALTERDMVLVRREIYPLKAPWPPTVPVEDAWVCLWGYPVEYRKSPTPADVDLTLMGAVMRVTNRGIGTIKCVFQRDVLVPVEGDVPHVDTNFGGMSGGPAFLMSGTSHQLVGIVTQHSPMIDMLQVQLFENIPEWLRIGPDA